MEVSQQHFHAAIARVYNYALHVDRRRDDAERRLRRLDWAVVLLIYLAQHHQEVVIESTNSVLSKISAFYFRLKPLNNIICRSLRCQHFRYAAFLPTARSCVSLECAQSPECIARPLCMFVLLLFQKVSVNH